MNCNKRANKLCEECDVCIGRSVFSHPKGQQYSSQNKIDSKFVTQKSNKKCLWDCIDCPHTFPARPGDFLRSKTNGCPYCANRKLCPTENNCQLCFNKSFASSDRAKNVVDKSIDLTQVFLNSHEPCEFWCECGHKFLSRYDIVTHGGWCIYCANQKLCPKEKNCQLCFNKSFASSERAKNVVDKSIDLTQIFLNSDKKCKFRCECGHTFPSTFNKVTRGHWCPYCANQKLCPKEKNCMICFDKSFASSDRAKNVVDKSIDLTQIFKGSNQICDFWCECIHVFPSSYNSVTQGRWCGFCCKAPKLICHKDENCTTCLNKSFASSERAHNVVDKSIDLTQVFLNSDKKCKFKCDKNHNPWITKYSSVTYGTWCPYCPNKTEQLIADWGEEMQYVIERKVKFDSLKNINCLEFDFLFVEENCLVENDGRHHFSKVEHYKTSDPEVVRATDVKKMKWALANGYPVVRICQEDVWNDKIDWDWRAELKKSIKKYKTPQIIYLAKDPHLYDKHREDMSPKLDQ